jgi:hypothetical protein
MEFAHMRKRFIVPDEFLRDFGVDRFAECGCAVDERGRVIFPHRDCPHEHTHWLWDRASESMFR